MSTRTEEVSGAVMVAISAAILFAFWLAVGQGCERVAVAMRGWM